MLPSKVILTLYVRTLALKPCLLAERLTQEKSSNTAIVILKEQRISYKRVYSTFLLGPANHQESPFKVKTYAGEKRPF